MEEGDVLIASLLCILLVLLALHMVASSHSRPITLTLAHLLRRAGRWCWAAGEGVEHGYRHTQRVRQQISLDLDVR